MTAEQKDWKGAERILLDEMRKAIPTKVTDTIIKNIEGYGAALNAMLIYHSQQQEKESIEFAEWIAEQEPYGHSHCFTFPTGEINERNETFTVEQLYHLYTESKQK